MPNSPQSRCKVCSRFIPAWDLHLQCVSHWDRDCSMLTPCNVCRKWTLGQWSYMEETVAREEAKAFLKASESRTGKRCSGEVVPPTDVLGKRPVHDISISPLSCNNRSPEARRRKEALAYARQVGSLADPTTLVGQRVCLHSPTW